MAHWDWSILAALLVSHTILGFGLACLLWAENSERESFGWRTTRKSRHLRILGWIGICLRIPLTILFGEEWVQTWFDKRF
jgi:hypothetical protein